MPRALNINSLREQTGNVSREGTLKKEPKRKWGDKHCRRDEEGLEWAYWQTGRTEKGI